MVQRFTVGKLAGKKLKRCHALGRYAEGGNSEPLNVESCLKYQGKEGTRK